MNADEAKKLVKKARPGFVGWMLDGAIGEIAPGWGRRRKAARMAMALGDGFDVTRGGRKRRSYGHAGGPADKHLDERTLFDLRELCRAADRQSPLIHGIIDRWIDNIVGPRIKFEPTSSDAGYNATAKEYITERMGRVADIRRRDDFLGLLRIWLRAIATDGQSLIVHTDEGIATYEADQLISPRGKGGGDKSIVNGVEVEPRTGRHLGYYVGKREYKGFYAGANWGRDATLIAAGDCEFLANTQRISQTVGVPILASGMGMYEYLDDYLESEQLGAAVAAHILYFIKRANPEFMLDGDGNLRSEFTSETAADGTEQQMLKSEAGAILLGEPGDELDMHNPTRPGQQFEPYITTCLRMIGAGLGIPLELVLLDFSKTNYSSARAALLQAYRTFMCWQEWVKGNILQPCYGRWIGEAMAEGKLPVREDGFKVQWLMPRWAWIDPLKEVVAAEKAVSMGIDTITDYIERDGQTLDDLVLRRKRELDAFRDAEIPTTTAPENLTVSARESEDQTDDGNDQDD